MSPGRLEAVAASVASGVILGLVILLAVGASWSFQPASGLKGALPVRSPEQLLSGRSMKAVVVDPELSPTEQEVRYMKEFLSIGGTIIVVGSGPGVNRLLSSLGLNVSTSEGVIADTAFNAGYPLAPLAGYDGLELALINASPILLGPGFSPMARTSYSSVLLLNGSIMGRGPFTVVARGRVGEGAVVLISSPYFATSESLSYYDNADFMKSLLNGSRPYLVEFLWAVPPSTYVAWQVAGFLSTSAGQLALLATALSLPMAVVGRARPERRLKESVEQVLRAHPHWDPQLLSHLAEERSKASEEQ